MALCRELAQLSGIEFTEIIAGVREFCNLLTKGPNFLMGIPSRFQDVYTSLKELAGINSGQGCSP